MIELPPQLICEISHKADISRALIQPITDDGDSGPRIQGHKQVLNSQTESIVAGLQCVRCMSSPYTLNCKLNNV